jgi:hypothetical protein
MCVPFPRPCLNCQVLNFTLNLAYSVLKESGIDRGFGAISGQLMDIICTVITSCHWFLNHLGFQPAARQGAPTAHDTDPSILPGR